MSVEQWITDLFEAPSKEKPRMFIWRGRTWRIKEGKIEVLDEKQDFRPATEEELTEYRKYYHAFKNNGTNA